MVVLRGRRHNVNVKRIHRLYRQANLAVRQAQEPRTHTPLNAMLLAPNQEWPLDFVADGVGERPRPPHPKMVGGFTRECPATEVGASVYSRRVTRVLERVIAERGAPQSLRCDTGPAFTSRHFLTSCEQRHIAIVHIQPGPPMQNGYVESVNGRFRDECLNANWFVNIADAKQKTEDWRVEYNAERPHSSLAYRTPNEHAEVCSELTIRIDARPPTRPSLSLDSTAVLVDVI